MPLAPLSGVGRPRLAGRVGVIKGAFRRQTHDTDTDRQRNARPKPRTDQSGRLADRHTTIRPRTPPAHAPKAPQTDAPNQSISTPPNSAGLKKLGLSQGTPCVPFFAHPQPGTLRYVGGWPLAGLVPGKSPPQKFCQRGASDANPREQAGTTSYGDDQPARQRHPTG